MRQKAHFQRDNTHKTVTDIRLCSLIRCCPIVGQSEYLLQCQICAAPRCVTFSIRLFRVTYSWALCANMTFSVKPEVANILQHSQRRTEPQT